MAKQLSVQEPSGNLVNQATQQIKPSTVFSETSQKVLSTPQSVEGQFGNFSGQIAMANTLTDIGSKLEDYVVRERNLKRANESERRRLHLAEIKEADFKARQQVAETSRMQELNADDREQLYNQYLDGNISAVNGKYKYETEVGNNVNEENDTMLSGIRLGFKKDNEEYRVKEYMTTQKMSWNKGIENVIEGTRQGGDALTAFKSLTDVFKSLDTPEFHGVYGFQAEATKLEWKRAALKDVIMSLPTATAVAVLSYDGPPETDPLKMMDPSDRVTLTRQMGSILRTEESAAKADKVERDNVALSTVQDNVRESDDPKVLVKIYHKLKTDRIDGKYDPKAVNPILNSIESKLNQIERHNEARAHTAAVKAQTAAAKQIAREEKADRLRADAYSGVTKANNDYYIDHIIPQMVGKTPQQQTAIQMKYVEESGRVPQPMRHSIERASLSSDPKIAQGAVEALRVIQQVSPQAYNDLPKDVVALDIKSRRMPINMAQKEIAEGNLRSAEENTRLKTRTGKLLEDKVVASFIKDRFGKVGITPALFELVRSTAIENSNSFSNPDDALEAAAKQIVGKGYGVTSLGGKDLFVQYPPESTFAASMGGEDQVKAAWDKDVVTKYGLDKTARPIYTGRMKDGKPTYFIVDSAGNRVFYLKDGKPDLSNPVVWQPSYQDTPMYRDALKKQDARTLPRKSSPLLNTIKGK